MVYILWLGLPREAVNTVLLVDNLYARLLDNEMQFEYCDLFSLVEARSVVA